MHGGKQLDIGKPTKYWADIAYNSQIQMKPTKYRPNLQNVAEAA